MSLLWSGHRSGDERSSLSKLNNPCNVGSISVIEKTQKIWTLYSLFKHQNITWKYTVCLIRQRPNLNERSIKSLFLEVLTRSRWCVISRHRFTWTDYFNTKQQSLVTTTENCCFEQNEPPLSKLLPSPLTNISAELAPPTIKPPGANSGIGNISIQWK